MKVLLVTALVGCGSVTSNHIADAPPIDAPADGKPDAMIDAMAPCPPLLVGGTDVTTQGWTVIQQAPATLTYGADYAQIQTTTTPGAAISGQMLLSKVNVFTPGQPFTLRAEIKVTTVNPHNQFDSAAAILGSFTPPGGLGADRSEMIYIDAGKIGWADDTSSAVHALDTTAFHTYELAVDAANTATVSIDNTPLITRANYTTSGSIAIGDQTNDASVDATMQIRSVTQVCH